MFTGFFIFSCTVFVLYWWIVSMAEGFRAKVVLVAFLGGIIFKSRKLCEVPENIGFLF